MLLSVIVAASENNVIGRGGALPWHLSADLQRFKQRTLGHAIVMGRRTFESIGRVLSGRTTIVVSRQAALALPEGVLHAHDLDEAIAWATQNTKSDELFVCGGAELYAATLPRADRLYLTRVHAAIDGDTLFPRVDWSQWQRTSAEPHGADAKNSLPMTFFTFERL